MRCCPLLKSAIATAIIFLASALSLSCSTPVTRLYDPEIMRGVQPVRLRSGPKAFIIAIDSIPINENTSRKNDFQTMECRPGPWYELPPGEHAITCRYSGFYRHYNPFYAYIIYSPVRILGTQMRGPYIKKAGESSELIPMVSDSTRTIRVDLEDGHRYELGVELMHNPLRPDWTPALPELIAPADRRFYIIDLSTTTEANKDGLIEPIIVPTPRADQFVISDFPWRGYIADLEEPLEKAPPLVEAIESGDPDFVELILATEDTDIIDADDEWGMTSLHRAAENGNLDIIRILIDRSASINVRNKMGATPLFYAAGDGHNDVVVELLEAGAEVEAKQKNNWTSLHHAVQGGHYETVVKLLQAGAKVDARTDLGLTALMIAINENHADIAVFLMDHGANPKNCDKEGWNPLHYAAQVGNTGIIRMLIDNGVDIGAQSATDCTPLHNAAVSGSYDAAAMLLNQGAAVDVVSNGGWTPLHMAAVNGDAGLGKLLIEKGADPQARLNSGLTPYDIASEKHHLGFIAMLRDLK